MPGVDVHQHLWPPSFVEALSRRHSVPRLEGDALHLAEGTYEIDLRAHRLEARLALLDAAGIDAAVVSLQPTLGLDAIDHAERDELELAWEEGILELAAAAGGRIVPLAARRPRSGFAGVSVGSSLLDDLDGLAPTLDALRGSGFLFVHPVGGAPRAGAPPWWPAVAEYTSQMQRAFLAWLAGAQERWPDVTVVFAILAGGGPIQLERLGSRGVDPASALLANVFFDTASYGPRALRLCVEAVGAAQLVFGTDVPVVDASQAAAALAALGGEAEVQARERTPRALLGRFPLREHGRIVQTDAP
jgi:predicted TIM-barrel fold metal-dependent hydrolase